VIDALDKERTLVNILDKSLDLGKVMIFVAQKRVADDLCRRLQRENFRALALHGDKEQGERDWVLNQFREGKCQLMIATDVASRGIDVKDIATVINYDFPNNLEDYVHRIGRTGRAGRKGTAISFFTVADSKKAKELIEVLKSTNQNIPDALFEFVGAGSGHGSGYGGGYKGGRGSNVNGYPGAGGGGGYRR
jgi:ATP-dependent RNA helicase DDX5/DBP2